MATSWPDVISVNQDMRLAAEWLSRKARREGQPFHVVLGLEFPETMNECVMEKALNDVIRRHDSLRSEFNDVATLSAEDEATAFRSLRTKDGWRKSIFSRRVAARVRVKLSKYEVETCEPLDPTFTQVVAHEALRRFTYNEAPLLRASIVAGRNAKALIVVFSHLIIDGLSLQVFIAELREAYRNGGDISDKGHGQVGGYDEFVRWQRAILERAPAAVQLACRQAQQDAWREHAVVFNDLSPYANEMECVGGNTGIERVECGIALSQRVTMFCRLHRVSEYVLFLGALFALARQRANQDEVAIRLACGNRIMAGSDRLIGWLSERRLLGMRVRREMSLECVVQEVNRALRDLMVDQYLPAGAIEHRTWQQPGLRNINEPLISLDASYRPQMASLDFGGGVIARRLLLPYTPRETVKIVVAPDVSTRLHCIFPRAKVDSRAARHVLMQLCEVVMAITTAPGDTVDSLQES